jgi:hypothetical protein
MNLSSILQLCLFHSLTKRLYAHYRLRAEQSGDTEQKKNAPAMELKLQFPLLLYRMADAEMRFEHWRL